MQNQKRLIRSPLEVAIDGRNAAQAEVASLKRTIGEAYARLWALNNGLGPQTETVPGEHLERARHALLGALTEQERADSRRVMASKVRVRLR